MEISPSTELPFTKTFSKKAAFELFLISFVILFLELSCIRYFASTVIFLTFFTNIVLMACFLGMSVGCLAASRKQNWIHFVIPLLFLALFLAGRILILYQQYGQVTIDVGNQQSPQLIFFGTEYRPKDPAHFVIPMEIIAGLFFVLIALFFTGLGQVMGRIFDQIPDRVAAYTVNILGSLAGILGFGLTSYFEMSPLFWFGLSLIILLYFARRFFILQWIGAAAILYVISLSALGGSPQEKIFWSPYYKIRYLPQTGEILTNNIAHQQMIAVKNSGPAYLLPHLLNRDSGAPPFEKILIIGAGSGNDVEAALISGAKAVDAVEIDPVLNRIGREHHPDRPYADPRVKIHLDDGRSFVKKTDQKYDLAIYALVDSLVLHSGYSSLRLESFLFTREALQDVKARLKPGGLFAMYNYYRQGWVVGRLTKMAEEVFGSRPIVISLPFQEKIRPEDSQADHITFILVGNGNSEVLEKIRKKLEESEAFWVNRNPEKNKLINAYGPQKPVTGEIFEPNWMKISPAQVDTSQIPFIPSDDWPFLYLQKRAIPDLNLRGVFLIALLSLALLFLVARPQTLKPDGGMFFLGAGFMLLETKGVVHMALLFGGTWVVNSVVFFAILFMTLLANLYVLKLKPKNLTPFYLLLMAGLFINLLVPMNYFLSLPGLLKTLISCLVIFFPIFFAGIIFAMRFRESKQPDVDLGSNIGGIILGGLSEYLSLMLGFQHLLWVAILYYLLSAFLGNRQKMRVRPA